MNQTFTHNWKVDTKLNITCPDSKDLLAVFTKQNLGEASHLSYQVTEAPKQCCIRTYSINLVN